MSAPVSGWFVREGIGSRSLATAIVAPFALVLALLFIVWALARYALTGRLPDDLDFLREDHQAESIRSALDRPETLIH